MQPQLHNLQIYNFKMNIHNLPACGCILSRIMVNC